MSLAATQGGSGGMERAATVRWTICFAVVVGAHAAGAMAFMSTPEPSDFDAGAPVIMLELPEVANASAPPPSDLAPGPPDIESEATPTPKEETKPPEEEAEVALPVPDPPRPEPPAEARMAADTPSVVLPPAEPSPPTPGAAVVQAQPPAVRRWQSLLTAQLEHFKRYPAEARSREQTGVTTVMFTIDRDGKVLSSSIVKSSGSQLLDQESLAMLVRAQPLPRPPANVPERDLSFIVPVRYSIR